MPPEGFEPTISAGERLQNYALDREATGIGIHKTVSHYKLPISKPSDPVARDIDLIASTSHIQLVDLEDISTSWITGRPTDLYN